MTFDKSSLEKLAQQLLAEHSLTQWKFEWDQAKRRLGCCKYGPKIISLSLPNAELNTQAVSIETLKHEIAHALTPTDGHGPKWKQMARQIGCSQERCADRSTKVVKGEYRALCPSCGKEFHIHRSTKKSYYCPCLRRKDRCIRVLHQLTFRHIREIQDPALIPYRILVISSLNGIAAWQKQVVLADSILLPSKVTNDYESWLQTEIDTPDSAVGTELRELALIAKERFVFIFSEDAQAETLRSFLIFLATGDRKLLHSAPIKQEPRPPGRLAIKPQQLSLF